MTQASFSSISSVARAASKNDSASDTSKSPIKVFDSIPKFRAWRRELALKGETLGFVPTMGAIHQGHLELVSRARSQADHVAVSIFVNPAQFAPHEDFAQYPRTFPTDLERLDSLGTGVVSAILLPQVADMYPSGIVLDVSQQKGSFVEVRGLSHQMEGKTRPHFFRGVATIVTKLFNIVQPDKVFFGQKDIQQCIVVRSMIRDLQFPVDMHVVPTARESDGLARSSRNMYLTKEQREVATVLYRALSKVRELYEQGARRREDLMDPAYEVVEMTRKTVESKGLDWDLRLDYLSLADPESLEELQELKEGRVAVLSGAVFVGTTRLIDNFLIGGEVGDLMGLWDKTTE